MNSNEQLIMKYHVNSEGTPISVFKSGEKKQVIPKKHMIMLDEIPDEFNRVRVIYPQGMYEVYDKDIIKSNNFMVDYNSGKVYFNEIMDGKEVMFEYHGTGLESIGTSRIFTKLDNNGDIVETLDDIIDNGYQSIEYLNTIGNAVVITDNLEKQITNGNNVQSNLNTTINIGNALHGTLTKDIRDGETKRQELITATKNAESERAKVSVAISNAENKRLEVETTINNANASKGELEAVIGMSGTSKSQLQSVISDSVAKNTTLTNTNKLADDRISELNGLILDTDLNGMSADVIKLKSDVSTIETKIIQGDGSGLNADLLDGHHGSEYVKHSETIIEEHNLANERHLIIKEPNGIMKIYIDFTIQGEINTPWGISNGATVGYTLGGNGVWCPDFKAEFTNIPFTNVAFNGSEGGYLASIAKYSPASKTNAGSFNLERNTPSVGLKKWYITIEATGKWK